ncbi:hypothetical protein KQI65_16305 [bacterium]|nr:hypothetical protein [bacterium]
MHILTAAILYTSAMGVGLLHGHPHGHAGESAVAAASDHHDGHAHESGEPCSRSDCDSRNCCNTHSHHLIAIRSVAVSNDDGVLGFRCSITQTPLSSFPHDIFHPPEHC